MPGSPGLPGLQVQEDPHIPLAQPGTLWEWRGDFQHTLWMLLRPLGPALFIPKNAALHKGRQHPWCWVWLWQTEANGLQPLVVTSPCQSLGGCVCVFFFFFFVFHCHSVWRDSVPRVGMSYLCSSSTSWRQASVADGQRGYPPGVRPSALSCPLHHCLLLPASLWVPVASNPSACCGQCLSHKLRPLGGVSCVLFSEMEATPHVF